MKQEFVKVNGARLAGLIAFRGFNKSTFAKAAGVCRPVVTDAVLRDRATFEMLCKMADCLGVKPIELKIEDGKPEPKENSATAAADELHRLAILLEFAADQLKSNIRNGGCHSCHDCQSKKDKSCIYVPSKDEDLIWVRVDCPEWKECIE